MLTFRNTFAIIHSKILVVSNEIYTAPIARKDTIMDQAINNKSVRINKTLLWISLVLCVALVVGVTSLVMTVSKYSQGVVTQVSVHKKGTDVIDLHINYLLAVGTYSVQAVSKDDGEYFGDGITDYDGQLGKYRIMIMFSDVEPSDSLMKKKDENGIIKLADNVLARISFPQDHGFVLYVGSDKPLSVEALENAKLNSFGGTIKISIAVENV